MKFPLHWDVFLGRLQPVENQKVDKKAKLSFRGGLLIVVFLYENNLKTIVWGKEKAPGCAAR